MYEYKDIIIKKTKEMILQDGENIIEYSFSARGNGVVQLSLVPYLALFCRSAQEFLGVDYIPDNVDEQINDLRNGLKIYSGKYNKGKKETLKIDEKQDKEFRDRLRFSFMKKWNVHYNLGVYFDTEGHIIGNTQNLNYFLQIPEIDVSEQHRRAFEIGRMLGEKTVTIINALGESINNTELRKVDYAIPKCGYRDFNTNKKNKFFTKTTDKEINLIMLHILSSIGFVEHILQKSLPIKNQWLFRVEYVVAHYAWLALKKVKQHFEQEDKYAFKQDLTPLINKGAQLFLSEFRNCMMHYDLCDKSGIPVIIEEKYDESIPFFGLVESCFPGESWKTFFEKLRNYLKEIEEYLFTWFWVEKNKIKWD